MFRERMKNMPQDVREKRFRNVGDPRRTDRFKSTYEYGVKSQFSSLRRASRAAILHLGLLFFS
jgi:hypothetical protein